MALKVVWRDGWAHIHGTAGGRRIRESLGTRDPEQAEELRAAAETKLHRERVYGVEAVATFDEAAEKYILHLIDQGKPVRYLAPIITHLRGRVLRTITPGDLKDMARKLYPDAKPATRRRQAITPAAAIINFAAENYQWCHPIKIRYPTGPKARKRAVGYDWIDAVRAEAARRRLVHLRALMLFLYQTGFRISEAARLEPADADLDDASVAAGRTKNGDPRRMALTPEMVEELRALPPRAGRLFGYTSEAGVRQALRRVCPGAGVDYLGTHQPGRHSFATALDGAMSAKAISDAGGWKTLRIVADNYLHPDGPERKAASILSRHKSDTPADTAENPTRKRKRNNAKKRGRARGTAQV